MLKNMLYLLATLFSAQLTLNKSRFSVNYTYQNLELRYLVQHIILKTLNKSQSYICSNLILPFKNFLQTYYSIILLCNTKI